MTELRKARLGEVDARGNVQREIPVQFNPTTLRLQRTNSIDAGRSRGRQVQQYNGTSSTTLTVELEFDTADDDVEGAAVDVRSHTQMVTRFVLPGGPRSRQAPPRVRFRWGAFVLIGVMSSANEDLDLFSPDGVPLRAKVSVSIKEQDPKFEALATGPAANRAPAAPVSGEPAGTGPGTSGTPSRGEDERVDEALDGETAPDFLSRQGLDPEAWRSIAADVPNPLSLLPGTPIGFDLNLPIGGLGIGFGAELALGGGVSLEASLGLQGSIGGAVGAGGGAPGFALAAAGGLTAAIETVAGSNATEAADESRSSFSTPTPDHRSPSYPRPRLRDAGGARSLPAESAAPAAAPPTADTRATSFGHGVPLRERITPPDARPARSPWVVVARELPHDEDTDRAGEGCNACSRCEGPAALRRQGCCP